MWIQILNNIINFSDHYFSRFTWKSDTVCLATWTNRMQTVSIAQLCVYNETAEEFNCDNVSLKLLKSTLVFVSIIQIDVHSYNSFIFCDILRRN